MWKSGRNNQKSAKPRRENRAGAGEAPKILPPAGQGRAPPPQFPTWGHPQIPETPPAGCIPNSKNNKTLKIIKPTEADTALPRPGRAARPPPTILLSVWPCSRHRKGQRDTTGTPVSPPIPCVPPPRARPCGEFTPRLNQARFIRAWARFIPAPLAPAGLLYIGIAAPLELNPPKDPARDTCCSRRHSGHQTHGDKKRGPRDSGDRDGDGAGTCPQRGWGRHGGLRAGVGSWQSPSARAGRPHSHPFLLFFLYFFPFFPPPFSIKAQALMSSRGLEAGGPR